MSTRIKRNSTNCKKAIDKTIRSMVKKGANINVAIANTLKKSNKICRIKK